MGLEAAAVNGVTGVLAVVGEMVVGEVVVVAEARVVGAVEG